MAKNISLLGADYPDVPAVTLPQTGGGTATFYDVEVTDGDPTLSWGTRSKVGTVNGTDMHVTMPANPLQMQVLEGTLENASYTDVNLPTGFNQTNTIIIGIMALEDNGWYDYKDNTEMFCHILAAKIRIYVPQTGLRGKRYKLAILKY